MRVAGWVVAVVFIGWCGSAGAQSVYVEDSPAAMELAERARQWRAQGRLTDAVAALVDLAETYPGKLMPVGDERFVDAAWWVRRELAGDEELRAVYERDAEPAAARALAEAMQAGAGADGGASWYDAEALAEVGRRYWLTASGLEANLAWCAVMLERGEPAAALAVLEQLEEHPSSTEQRFAARRSGLIRAGERMRSALAAAAPSAWVGDGGLSTEPASLDGALWTAWWNDLAAGADGESGSSADQIGVAIRQGQRIVFQGQRGRGNARPGLTRLGLQPGVVLSDDAVWASDGMSVASVDRASGRTRWARWWPTLSGYGQAAALGQSLLDHRGVMLSGGHVYAVLGPARVSSPRNRRARMQGDTGAGLWCFDREDGSVVWSVEPSDLDASFEQAGFMGVPVDAGPGVVAVRLRRVQPSGFVDTYVAGLDAATGAMRWSRHLASTSHPNGMGAMPPVTPMVAAGGRLFVDEGLGVAAALDPRDGGLWWLRKTLVEPEPAEVDFEPDGDGLDDVFDARNARLAARRALTAGVQGQTGPAVLNAGVMISVMQRPDEGRGAPTALGAWLLDPATGEVMRPFNADAAPWVERARWTAVNQQGLGGPADTLLVQGANLWCLDAETFETRWMKPNLPVQVEDHHCVPVVDGDRVLVGAGPSLRVYRLEDGELQQTLAWPTGAAWAAGRGELVSATPQAVNGFVSVTQGQQRLRRRIASAEHGPDDPEPGLALATLGVAAERADLLLEGATAALQSLRDHHGTDSAGTLDDADVTAMLNALSEGRDPLDATTLDDAEDPEAWSDVALSEATDRSETRGRGRAVSVVLELIRLAADDEALPPEARRAVFDKVAASVSGPDELVAYHLALGPLEREANQPGDAASHYQAILRDPVLADRMVEIDGQLRRAGLAAGQHLTSLVAEYGFAIYEPFEQQARRELARLTADATTRPDQLIALADRYPLAEASALALLEAAAAYEDADDPRRAAAPFRRAYRTARTPDTRARAVGGLASLYVRQGRVGTAQSWLQRVAREFPALQPIRDGLPVPLSAWVADLQASADAASPLPIFDPSSAPTTWSVPGRLMPVDPAAEASHRRDRAVVWQTHNGQRVAVIDLEERRAERTVSLPARDAVVLRFSDDHLLLFSPERGEVYAIDLAEPQETNAVPLRINALLDSAGKPLATTPDGAGPDELGGVIEELQIENLNVRGGRVVVNNGGRLVVNGQVIQVGQPDAAARFAVASDDLLILADSAGRVVAVDRLTHQTQWTYRLPGAVLTGLQADDDTAVLTGLVMPNTNMQSGLVVALDLLTGQPRAQPIREPSQAPLDARPLPDGTLLITFPTFIASYTTDNGQLRWRTPKPFDLDSPFVAPPIVRDGVVAATFSPALPHPTVLLIDPATGNPQARITADIQRVGPAPPGQRLAVADGRLHILSSQPACFADNGLALWRSAVHDIGMHGLHHALSAKYLLVLLQSAQPLPAPPDTDTPATRYRLDAYERDTGRLVAQHPLDLGPAAVITQLSRLYDHHLAYSNKDETIFVTASP